MRKAAISLVAIGFAILFLFASCATEKYGRNWNTPENEADSSTLVYKNLTKADMAALGKLYSTPKLLTNGTVLVVLTGKFQKSPPPKQSTIDKAVFLGFVYAYCSDLDGSKLGVGISYDDNSSELYLIERGKFKDYSENKLSADAFTKAITKLDIELN